jgi:hypothetical protein
MIMDYTAMKPFQQRVVEEKAELDIKLRALRLFVGGQTFNELPEAERARLNAQEHYMTQYSQVLGERIEAFAVAP